MWGAIAQIGAEVGGQIFANEQNKYMAKKQREWMERMSNTAHQREVKDLRAAGLNPILSAGGSGAQVGTPSVGAPMGNLGEALSRGIASAMAFKSAQATLKQQSATATQTENQLKLQEGMMQWLRENPRASQVIYPSMLAKEAGMNSTVVGPMLGLNSAATKRGVSGFIDTLFKRKLDSRYDELNRESGIELDPVKHPPVDVDKGRRLNAERR